MRLRKISLRDFKNHFDTNLEFGDMTLLVGPSGSGKSSIAHGITMALTGKTPNTDQGGRGAKDHIRLGQEKFEVFLSVQNGSEAFDISRSQTQQKQTLLVPWGTDIKGRQALLLDHLGVSGAEEAIEALLDPRIFADRRAEEQKQILLKLMKTSAISVPQAAKDYGITEIASVTALDDHLDSLKTEAIRDLNRVINKELLPNLPIEPDQEEWTKFNSLTQEKAQARGRLDGLQVKLGGLKRSLASIEEASRQASEVETAKTRLATLEPKRKELEDELKALSVQVIDKQNLINHQEALLRGQEAKLQIVREQHKAVSGMGSKCGVVEKFICPLSDGEKHDMGKSLQWEIENLEQALRTLNSALVDDRKELTKTGALGRQARAVLDQVNLEIATLKGTIDRAQGAALHTDVPDKLQADITATEAEIASVRQRSQEIDTLLTGMDTAGRAERFRNASQRLTETRKRLETAKAACESLEKLKETLLASTESQSFVEEANKVWHRFYPKSDISVRPDGLWIRADSESEVAVPFLSNGQKLMLDCSIRIAAARTTGFNVLALDNSNALPQEQLQLMFNALKASGCQVILIYASSSKPTFREGIEAYRLSSDSIFGPVHCEKV